MAISIFVLFLISISCLIRINQFPNLLRKTWLLRNNSTTLYIVENLIVDAHAYSNQ